MAAASVRYVIYSVFMLICQVLPTCANNYTCGIVTYQAASFKDTPKYKEKKSVSVFFNSDYVNISEYWQKKCQKKIQVLAIKVIINWK